MREPSYFFRLSAWGDRLLAYYDAIPDRILPPTRRNEVISFVRGGLRDLAVSRSGLTWGVPVPDDPGHVMYVWLDALINYVTACGFPDETDPLWRFWPADIHVVGKDIIRFHAVIWPAICLAADLPAPKHIIAHGWWTARGEKMSKSLGNAIDGIALVETYGLDAVRFFVLREIPFGNDGGLQRRRPDPPPQRRARQRPRQPRPTHPVPDRQEPGWHPPGSHPPPTPTHRSWTPPAPSQPRSAR